MTSPDELISLVRDGMKHRATHSTNIHEHSSRSHLIVTVQVTGTCGEGGLISAANSISSLQLNATITPVSSTETTPMVSLISSGIMHCMNHSGTVYTCTLWSNLCVVF